MKAVPASKIVLDSIGLRDRPESLIRESQPRTRFSARTGSSRVQAAERNNLPVEHPADNHRARVRRQRLGRPEARIRQNLGSG